MILVTGGSGFIGQAAVRRLNRYAPVLAIDLHRPESVGPGVRFENVDMADGDGLESLFRKYEITVVVHLASLLNSQSNRDPRQATEINVLGSCQLLEWCMKYHALRFVYGSSISAYGPLKSSPKKPIRETAVVNPNNVYGATKRYVELLGDAYAYKGNFDFVSLRIASVIGPGSASPSSAWRSRIYRKNEKDRIPIPHRRKERLPLVCVESVAEMIEILARSHSVPHSIYNTPSETWRLADLEELFRERKPDLRWVYGEKPVTDIPRFIDGRLFCEDFSFVPMSIEKSLELIE